MKKKTLAWSVLCLSAFAYGAQTLDKTESTDDSKVQTQSKNQAQVDQNKISAKVMLLASDGVVSPSNPLAAVSSGSALLQITPFKGNKYLQNSLINIPLDDGLVFRFNLRLALLSDGNYDFRFTPADESTGGSSFSVTKLQTADDNTVAVISSPSSHIGYSTEHYYSMF